MQQPIHEILNNDIYRCGRVAIYQYDKRADNDSTTANYPYEASLIKNNHLYDGMRMAFDGGGFYTFDVDGGGTNISYNWVQDMGNTEKGNCVGIYLDMMSKNFLVHHNVVWSSPDVKNPAMYLGTYAINHKIYNNTLIPTGGGESIHVFISPNVGGTHLDIQTYNNLSPANNNFGDCAHCNPNINDKRTNLFDPAANFLNEGYGGLIYRLDGFQDAVNSGTYIPGITENTSSVPDIGAYELGGSDGVSNWVAGCELFSGMLKLEAEDYDEMNGISENERGNITAVTSCNNNDWLGFKNVNLDRGFHQIAIRMAIAPGNGGKKVEVRLGSPSGEKIGEVNTQETTGAWMFLDQPTSITNIAGMQDVYFVCIGSGDIGNIDNIVFFN